MREITPERAFCVLAQRDAEPVVRNAMRACGHTYLLACGVDLRSDKGREAVAVLQKFKPTCLVLAPGNDRQDVADALKCLRALPTIGALPIVLVGAFPDAAINDVLAQYGVAGLVRIPATAEQFLACFHAAVSAARAPELP